MNSKITAIICLLGMLANPLLAGALTEVKLQKMNHETATLTVVGPDGIATQYSPAQLEAFPTYSLTTTTHWRDGASVFEGVLLSDILAANHLENDPNIKVTAEDQYNAILSKELIDSVPILVATRVDGKPHSRRMRGPIQFIIDAETFANSPLTNETTLVWMAARIEGMD